MKFWLVKVCKASFLETVMLKFPKTRLSLSKGLFNQKTLQIILFVVKL
jgi:hypothetical protein